MRGIPLSLVHVIDASLWAAPPLDGQAALVETGEFRKIAAENIIADAVGLIAEATGFTPEVDTEIVMAATVPALVDLSRNAQMMVVGCRGQSMLRRLLLGSVSSGLIHHASCPVAVIHDEAPFVLQPSQLPVVLGIDGSPASELATEIAFGEASWRGVELVALHAWTDADASGIPSMEWSARKIRAEQALAERLAGWQERYPEVVVRRRLVRDHPARHLLDEADSSQLVVVGSRGRGGFSGLLLGSVSTAIAQVARAPVIVARPR